LISVFIHCDALPDADVVSAEIVEELSVPTSARVVVHVGAPLDELDTVGTKAKLQLQNDDGDAVRTFELVVFSASAIETDQGDLAFELELRHETALLALRRDARVFLDMTAKDVVTKVFSDAGVASQASWSVERALVTRESCVQYRESDLEFVQRLLAEEGVFWFVKDADGGLALGDAKGSFEPIKGEPKIPFTGEGRGFGIDAFEVTHETVSDVFTHTDFAEKMPGVDLRSTEIISDTKASEIFEYPGGHATQAAGSALAKVRAEEIASRGVVATGTCARAELAPGSTFELGPAPNPIAKKWLLRAVTHRLGGGSGEGNYANAFVCSPLDLPYRPTRPARRRAKENGAHVIVVGGESGEEIHTDNFGRMRGTFAFDRIAESKKMQSPWMRVAQPMLGGSMTIARVGWEMAVRYIDGDVNRPIAVARLLDAIHPPPAPLPGAATTSMLRTPSSPNAEKFNAIVVKDESGGMLLSIFAAKDFDATVNNDRRQTIGGDETYTIGKDATTLLGGKQTVTIDGNDTLEVKGDAGVAVAKDRDKEVHGAEKSTIGGKSSVSVAHDDQEETNGARSLQSEQQVTETLNGKRESNVKGNVKSYAKSEYDLFVAGNLKETIKGTKTTTADKGTLTTKVGGDYTITVSAARTENVTGKRLSSVAGACAITTNAAATFTATGNLQIKAQKISITSKMSANVLAGGGVCTVSPASVTILGTVTLNGKNGVELAGNPGLAG
jgi:type VI secretion system secreted protein VgrG